MQGEEIVRQLKDPQSHLCSLTKRGVSLAPVSVGGAWVVKVRQLLLHAAGGDGRSLKCFMRVYVCIYIYMYVCMYVFMYVCMYVCMYVYTHTHLLMPVVGGP